MGRVERFGTGFACFAISNTTIKVFEGVGRGFVLGIGQVAADWPRSSRLGLFLCSHPSSS